MASNKSRKTNQRAKTKKETPQKSSEADWVRVGEEPVPGMKLRCICRGHTGFIGRIAWSPSGRFIASPSVDKTIRIWDASDGRCLAVLQGHTKSVYCTKWASNGAMLASGGSDASICLWSVDQGANAHEGLIVRKVKELHGHKEGVYALAWMETNDPPILWSVSSDTTLRMWDIRTGRLVKTINLSEIKNETGYRDLLSTMDLNGSANRLVSNGLDCTVRVWDAATGKLQHALCGHDNTVGAVAWCRTSERLVSGSSDRTVRVWNNDGSNSAVALEGHSENITSVCCSFDDAFLASKSFDNSIRLWNLHTFLPILTIPESSASLDYFSGLAFHPANYVLATLCENDTAIRIWELDDAKLLGNSAKREAILYTSAKLALVGESNVGKSCLAMRLAEDRYPKDEEQGTTHGMRFWQMEAKKLYPAAAPPKGQRRDVVLWDFGGQDEYQLVHQMFLHDTTLALVLIDPTRGGAALDEARDWNKRLEKHLGKVQAVKLLVGTKVDKKSDLIDQNNIEGLCKECGFAAFLDLSAKSGRNIQRLRRLISESLDWNQLARTSRPELFQHIRDDIEARRKKKQIVLTLDAFKKAIKQSAGKMYEEPAVDAVSDQLATQGIIVRTKLSAGDEALVLQLPVIERYAGSLIVAARNNPRGVPVLEERLLGSASNISLPGMTKEERLERDEERTVLECVVELMIQHGICFRHGGLLVFPTLFPDVGAEDEKLAHSVSLFYDFTGAIDNIYASLVARLMVGEEFGEGRLWSGRVEFDRPGEGMCGIRQVKRKGGFAHVDLFFADETPVARRDLFTRFVEEHLRLNGVEIREHQAIKCPCGKVIEELDVQANIALGEKDVICPRCRTKRLISESVARIRERDPESDQKILALRKKIEQRTAEDAVSAKKAVAGTDSPIRSSEPIRILHLSDLHFEKDTSPAASLQWLLQDLRADEPNFPRIEKIEYLVLSGDVTHRGDSAGFDKARQFVLELLKELGLDALRCVFVPGNHDIERRDSCYRFQSNATGLRPNQFVQKADVYLVRDESDYPNRLKQFSDAFYHKVTSAEDYPLAPERQGFAYFFEDSGVQFLALNTAWEIDQFFPKRASVHAEALANSLATADKQVRDAVEHRDMKKDKPRLRIAVFHHAIQGPWAMQNLDFLSNLQTAGVKLCLHGDVHEMRRQLIDHLDEDRNLRVIGAGTFGAKRDEITEGSARSYNLLEITRDLSHVRVYVREQPKPDGAWRGWNHFPDPEGGRGEVPFFDIDLT